MARTILLVEDNAKVMKLNSEALTMRGYRVLEAETLAKGRELFLSENPDLIVLDGYVKLVLKNNCYSFVTATSLQI